MNIFSIKTNKINPKVVISNSERENKRLRQMLRKAFKNEAAPPNLREKISRMIREN